jgi:hypothetical protein
VWLPGEPFEYSRKQAIELLVAKAGWGGEPSGGIYPFPALSQR